MRNEPSSGGTGPVLGPSKPRIDVIVPVYNGLHVVRPCLESVLRWTDPSVDRVTVVSDGCDATTLAFLAEWVERFGNARLFDNGRNLGFVRSCNRGLESADADLCLLLNSDTCVTPRWADKIAACMESDPSIGVASPLSNFAPNMRIDMLPGRDYLEMNALLEESWDGDYPDVTTPEGFCFVVSRRCLAEIGYLDTAYDDGYGEESDLSLRASYSGFRTVCVTDTYIYHRGRASFGGERREALYRSSRKVFNRRWRNKYPLEVEEFRRRDPIAAVRARLADAVDPPLTSAYASPEKKSVPVRRPLARPGARSRARRGDAASTVRTTDALHILCVLPTLNPYGGVVSIANHLSHLFDLGHRVTLLSMSRMRADFLFPKFEPVLVSPDQDLDGVFGDQDILLATSWETVSHVRRLADHMPRAVPVYYVQDIEGDFFGDEESEKRRRALASYGELPHRIVKTRHLENRLRELGWACHRISPGMNLDLFYPRDLPGEKEPTVLGMARPGAPNDIRGFRVLERTFELLASERPDLRLECFGSDRVPAELRCDHNHGRLRRSALPAVFSAAGVFVETSLMHGFGRTGVEAMACGTACVLSDSGGISEYARDEENALIVATGDAEATAEAIIRLMDDDDLRSRIARSGFETVQAYDDRRATAELLDLLRRLSGT